MARLHRRSVPLPKQQAPAPRFDPPVIQVPPTPSVHFEPRNDSQRELQHLYFSHDVLFAVGAAGSGKTLACIALAVMDILSRRTKRDKIILLRPAIEAEESLGFLAGNLQEKIAPFHEPFYHCLKKISSNFPKECLEARTFAHLRGASFENAIVLIDESQNLSYSCWKMALTRMGDNCKILCSGDPDQSDLDRSPMLNVMKKLEGAPGFASVRFPETAVVRHSFVREVLRRL